MSSRRKISSRIKLARNWQGLSQTELGDLTNRSQSIISRIEAAKQSIDAEDMPLFSRALGVDTQFFISDDVDINQIFRVD
jgi:transcriptional regulator with XRE-family HTH domain